MFFDQQHQALAARQQQLQARITTLRGRMAIDGQALRTPLALADQVRTGWRWLQAHPEVVGAAVLVLALLRPRRVLRLGGRMWAGWQLWQRARRWRARLGPLLPPRQR